MKINISYLYSKLPKFLRRRRLIRLLLYLFPESKVQLVKFNQHGQLYADISDPFPQSYFASQYFEAEFFNTAVPFLQKGGTFFDIGANFGFCTFGLAAELPGKKITYHLFEANGTMCERLTESSKLFPGEKFKINHVAVTNQAGDSKLYIKPGHLGGSYLSPSQGTEAVRNLRLDDYIKAYQIEKINFMKMDIEGSEPAALRGCEESLRKGVVETLYFEVSQETLSHFNSSPQACISLLKEFGFSIFYVKPGDFQKYKMLGAQAEYLAVNGKKIKVCPIETFPEGHETDLLAIHKSSPLLQEMEKRSSLGKTSLKIALISDAFSAAGGVGNYVVRLFEALQRAGHTPVVIHNDIQAAKKPGTYYIKDLVTFEPVPAPSVTHEVLTILKKEKPDLVHVLSNNNFPLESEIRSAFPSLKTLHVYDFCPTGSKFHHVTHQPCHHAAGPMCIPRMVYKRCTLSKRPQTLDMFYRRAMASTKNDSFYKKIVVPSEYTRQEAILSGYPPEQVENCLYFTECPETTGPVSYDRNTILFSGRIVPEKGLDYLLKAAAQIKKEIPWKLLIAGDGPDLEKMKKLAEKLGISAQTQFLGWQNTNRMIELYREATVVVMASIWPEPFGCVGIEAMSYAKPVIAFDAGGIPEWLDHGRDGFLVPLHNISEMAARIEFFLANPAKAKEMGLNGRNTVIRKFSPEKHLERLMPIYQTVLDDSKS